MINIKCRICGTTENVLKKWSLCKTCNANLKCIICGSTEHVFKRKLICKKCYDNAQCKICGSKENVHRKVMLCDKCYQRNYSKKYYEEHKNDIKNNSKKNYYNNHEKNLEYRKKYREKIQFDDNRQKALERANNKCEICGSKKDLIVHHKDKKGRGSKIKNNSLDNLIVLCKSCHIKEHRKDLLNAKEEQFSKKWALKYDKCIVCGTTNRKHQAKGMCVNCYAKYMRNKNK